MLTTEQMVELSVLLDRLAEKGALLAHRAKATVAVLGDGESEEFCFEMVLESASAIEFWAAEAKKLAKDMRNEASE